MLSAAVASALLLQSAAAPPPRLVRPPGRELAFAYPTGARQSGVEGRATVVCAVKAGGELDDCRAQGEAPEGWGFGVAAAGVARRYRVEPASPGATLPPDITFPIQFGLKAPAPSIRVLGHDGWGVLQRPYRWREAFPPQALRDGVSGEAEVRCAALPGGKATCAVVRESPAGYGFGAAALELRPFLRLSPPPGGAAATGRSVRMTFLFDARND